MSGGRVTLERHGDVARLTFDHPAAYNALDWTMWRELADHCTTLAGDRAVRVVTFRGAGGKAFVSGTDISGFLDFETAEQGIAYEREVGTYVETIEALPQPTVALIEGWAVGGGLAIAFACDFRIATAGSRFGSPIGRTIGNCLAARSYARILAHVGPAITKRMLLLGEILTAEELNHLSLITDVVAADEMDAAADTLCARLAENAPLTTAATKEAIRRIIYADLPDIDDLIGRVYASHDFRNGVRNFLAKRKAVWTGD
jgi:enoyl-CoA hydratase/carnithine racemase